MTSGDYHSPVLSLLDAGTYNPPFVAMFPGLRQAESALINGIESGMSYLNVHTMNNPGSEIRRQLFPAPEPMSLVLLDSALVSFGLMRHRKSAPSGDRAKP